MKMNREEMLEYLKGFDGKFYKEEAEVVAAVKKVENLLKKFGFKLHESFSARCRDFRSGKKDTSWFWRFEIAEYEYIEVQTGHLVKMSNKAYGRSRTRYPRGYEGLLRVSHVKVSLNPETGKPWQIGDTKYSADGCYSVTLTKRGWYSGD